MLKVNDCQLLIPASVSYQYPFRESKKDFDKGSKCMCCNYIISVEAAVPDTTNKQYRPY